MDALRIGGGEEDKRLLPLFLIGERSDSNKFLLGFLASLSCQVPEQDDSITSPVTFKRRVPHGIQGEPQDFFRIDSGQQSAFSAAGPGFFFEQKVAFVIEPKVGLDLRAGETVAQAREEGMDIVQ